MIEQSPSTPSDSEGFKFPSKDAVDSSAQELQQSSEMKMKESKNWSVADWKDHQDTLKDEPYLAADPAVFVSIDHAFFEIERKNELERMSERFPEAPIESVETRLIVHSPSFKNWGDSYHQMRRPGTSERGENAVIEIACEISVHVNGILENPNIAPEDRPSEMDRALEGANIFGNSGLPVCLKAHEGPRGPIYFVQDGSHRVAAAKLVGMDRISVRVGNASDKTMARKVWYESLVLMSGEAQNELRAIYDQVYPPTKEEKIADDAAWEEVQSRREEIQQELDSIHQKLDQESQIKFEQFKDIETQYTLALALVEQMENTERFKRLHREAGLAFLKLHAQDSLWEEYRQEIDEQGYLVRKDGKTGYISSIGYDIGDSYKQILIGAIEEYRNEFPNEFGPDAENNEK